MPKVKVTKNTLWKAIRKQCLECVCNSDTEVSLCTAPNCSLYKFRFGRSIRDTDPEYIPGTVNQYRVAGKIVLAED